MRSTHRSGFMSRRDAAACLVLGAIIAFSGRYTARLGYRQQWLALEAGCLTAIWVKSESRHRHWPRYVGGVYDRSSWSIRWWPAFREHLNLRYLDLPLWMPIGAFGTWRTAVWIRDRRRFGKGRCPACAYDLRGNTTGVCPECGAAAGS